MEQWKQLKIQKVPFWAQETVTVMQDGEKAASESPDGHDAQSRLLASQDSRSSKLYSHLLLRGITEDPSELSSPVAQFVASVA